MAVSPSRRLSTELDAFGLPLLCLSDGSKPQKINELHLHVRHRLHSNMSNCKYCEFRGTSIDVQAHLKECVHAQVQCIYCCRFCTQRSLISEHEKVCDFRIVPCSIPGCTKEYRKKDEAEHFDNCRVEHMKAVADLSDQLEQAKADYQRVQDQLKKEKEKPDREELWHQVERNQKKLDDQQQQIDCLKRTKIEQQVAIESRNRKIENRDLKIEKQDARIKDLEADLEAESTALKKEIQDLKEEIKNLQEKIRISTRRENDGEVSEFEFEISGYRERRETGLPWTSQEVNTNEGHKFVLEVGFDKSALHWKLYSVKSEVDNQLQWPIQKCVLITLTNSVGNNSENYYRHVSWEKPQQEREPVEFLSIDGQPDNSKISLNYSKVPFFLCNKQLGFKLLLSDSA